MNSTRLSQRQAAYLRLLAGRAHRAGLPHLVIDSFTRAQATEWISYLEMVVEAEERVRHALEEARRKAEPCSAPSPASVSSW